MNLRANMVDEFPVTLSCLEDQTWSEGTKMMKLMRSSEVSNLFCNLKKSSRKVVWYCTKVVAFSDRRLWNEWGLLKFLKFKYEHFRSLFKAAESRFQNLNVGGKSLEFISQSQIRGDYNLNKVRRLVTSIYAKKKITDHYVVILYCLILQL